MCWSWLFVEFIWKFLTVWNLSAAPSVQSCFSVLNFEIITCKVTLVRHHTAVPLLKVVSLFRSYEKTFEISCWWETVQLLPLYKVVHSVKQFKINLRVLTLEKTYRFTQYTKLFAYFYDLQHHLKSHTGEKQYSCSLSSKSFSWVDQLNVYFSLWSEILQLPPMY